jgi:RHS repeat-associated protein
VLYLHRDHLGSIDAVTTAGGQLFERRAYAPFGARMSDTGEPVGPVRSMVTQGFGGHEEDVELGLINMGGRMYDSKTGRFVTTDPIVSEVADSQDWNLYAYAWNNPLTVTDPSGLQEDPLELREKAPPPTAPPPIAPTPTASPVV